MMPIGSRRERRGAVLAVLTGVTLAVTAVALARGLPGAGADAGQPSAMSIDLMTDGNTATALGPRDDCREVSPGGTVTFDVTVEDIPASNPMIGFAFSVLYPEPAIQLVSYDPDYLLGSAPGSSILPLDEPPQLGVFNAGAIDLGEESREWGSGVLERISVTVAPGAVPGGYTLLLDFAAIIDLENVAHPPVELRGARLAVGGVTCASLPTPTPVPTPTPCASACPTAPPTPTPGPQYKKGDVDCNGNVNAVDGLRVLRYLANLQSGAQSCATIGLGNPVQGDEDCDGFVEADDFLELLRYAGGFYVAPGGGCPPLGS